MTTTGSPRRQDLDLMRAAVVGGLIFFHTARIFDPLDFYVKDQPPNLPLTLFVFFAGLWGMPLLFVVSGLGAWYSLRSRTATGFVRERLARLLVPFLVGLLLVVPPQVYYRLRFQGQDPGSYWQFYGTSSRSTLASSSLGSSAPTSHRTCSSRRTCGSCTSCWRTPCSCYPPSST
jgi:hypothetical protein